jgi:LPS O-antigen subunit length determinant protein (WzzB/FepE family)
VTEETQIADESISLLDIYDFLQQGWKTLLAACFLGGGLGLTAAFLWPEKYEASALIQPARVLSNDVESQGVLAEKMRSPTYYSEKTLEICRMVNKPDPRLALTLQLSPKVARQSTFVSLTFRGQNSREAVACLEAVLADVKSNQQDIAAPQIELAQLQIAKQKERLKQAEDFLDTFGDKKGLFKFNDTKFSASSLLIATLQARQSEITELKNSIQATEKALTPPQTRPTSFATPIYAPALRVEPKRSLVVLACAVAGLGLGFFWLLSLRAVRALKRQLVQR